jgi:riboflavin synthase
VFTGIITHLGRLEGLDLHHGGARLMVKVEADWPDLTLGASIAHEGCCLTVVEISGQSYALDASHETLNLTTLGRWHVGQMINLERAIKIGDELGGHIVSGHVDGVAHLVGLEADGNSFRLKLKVPAPLHRFIAPKGSVALDGISLTVNEVEGDVFGVNIIPHTWSHTTLKDKKIGDALNLEVDRLARYAARWHETSWHETSWDETRDKS